MLVWNKTKNKFYFCGKEITEAEYNEILATLRNRPAAPDGYGYRLTEDLVWKMYEAPVEEEIDEEVSAEETFAELLEVLG